MAGKLWRRWWSRSFENARRPRPSFRPRLEGLECRLAPALTATGLPVSATEGASFSGPVASVTDSNPLATPATLSATIDWGDGTTSPGDGQAVLIQPDVSGPGKFTVNGSHTYTDEGSYPIQVVVTDTQSGEKAATGFVTQTNLVSNTPNIPAAHTDSNLVNPWGIAFSPGGPFWISDNGAGVTTLYDSGGIPQGGAITIPKPPRSTADHSFPTGQVFNSTSGDFAGFFLFSTEDGTLAAWSGGSSATLEVDNSASGAVYKGLALDSNGSANFLYATNFHAGTIDVFNGQFHPVTTPGGFPTPNLPAGYAPFGIQNIGGNLYVTYAKQDAAQHDDVPGAGNGYVYEYDANGHLVRQVAAAGTLNSPWAVTLAPADFGQFGGDLLVGNFGDGTINAFDPVSGTFLGQLNDSTGAPLAIDGLWDLKFGGQGNNANTLYFTAGPNSEADGLFGSLAATAPGKATVADATLTPTQSTTPVQATEGQSFSGVVANFTDANAAAAATDFSASIDWGDGNTTPADSVVADGNGGFNVKGTHTYDEEGSHTISVAISDKGGARTTATSGVTVSDAALTGTPVTITARQGQAIIGNVVARFTDADPAGTASDYSASIDWGDGNTTPADGITAGANNDFDVVGSHTYTQSGTFTVKVTIQDHGTPITVDSTANVAAVADLGVTMTGPDTATAGTDITYTLTLTNNGPSDAHNVTLSDTLPAGETLVSQSQPVGQGFTLAANGNAISDTAATLPTGASATFTVIAHVGKGVTDGTSLNNSATASSDTIDTNSGNDTGSKGTVVHVQDDLSVTASGPDTAIAGTEITYTIGVSNSGPSDAPSVTLSDTLPAGVTFVSEDQPAGPTFTFTPGGQGNVENFSIASLPANTSATFTVVGRVAANVADGTTLTSTASADPGTTDSNTGNNSQTVTTTAHTQADLAISLAGPLTALAGTSVNYTITLSNLGPSDAQGVNLSDTLPAGLTLLSQNQTDGPVFTRTGSGNSLSDTLATLPAGISATFIVVARVGSNVMDDTVLKNTPSVSSTTTDPTPDNNSQSASTTVFTQADLAVTMKAPRSVIVGNHLTYTLSVTNLGPSDAQAVSLSDTLPSTEAFLSQKQTGGPTFTRGHNGNKVLDTIATLPAGASATFTIVAAVIPGAHIGKTITNKATAHTSTVESSTTNNSASSKVQTLSNLALTVSAAPATVQPGGEITYLVTIRNLGSATVTKLDLMDVLPAHTTFVSPEGSVRSQSRTAVTLNAGNLAGGHKETVKIVLKVNAGTKNGTRLVNTLVLDDAEDRGAVLASGKATTTVKS